MDYHLAKNCYIKSVLSWKNKNSNGFDGIQNDEVTKEITSSIISVSFISWFTCAVIGSFGVVTNRIRTAIVGFSYTLIDV